MEPTRFDRLTKGLVRVRSRRDLLRVLAAGSSLGVGAYLSRRLDAGAAVCAGQGQPCTDNEDCCGELRCDTVSCGPPKPVARRETCVDESLGYPTGAECTANLDCCSGCCVLGPTDSDAVRGTCAPTADGAGCSEA